MKFNLLQNNFSSGELSPKLKGRTDVKEYFNGCETLENFIVLPSGGATRRPGTRHLVDYTSGTTPTRIIPFKFSKKESYIIVITLSSGLPIISILDTEGNGLMGSLVFTTTFMSTEDKEDVDGWNYAQSGDALFLVHRSGTANIHVLKRTAKDSFSLLQYNNAFYDTALKKALTVPYLDLNATAVTIDPNAGGTTLTASAGIFSAGHVGAYFRYRQASGADAEGIYLVTAYTSPTEVAVTELVAPAARDASVYWQESAFSGVQGFPRTVYIFEQRLVLGGTVANPDSLFFSKVGNIFQLMQDRLQQDASTNVSGLGFSGAELTTDPFFVTISSDEVDEITWLGGFKELLVGTLGSEMTVTSDAFLSPTDIKIRKQTAHGGKNVKPVQIDNVVYFVSADGRKLRSFKFNDANGSFVSNDISLLNDTFLHHNVTEDFFDVEIDEIVYQRSTSILWIRSTSNQLIGVTVSTSGEVTAWHKHTLGGTDVEVIGLASISRTDTGYEDLFLLVRRTINGASSVTIEKIGPLFEENSLFNTSTSDDAKPIFCDSCVVIQGPTEILGTEEDEEGLEAEDGSILILE